MEQNITVCMARTSRLLFNPARLGLNLFCVCRVTTFKILAKQEKVEKVFVNTTWFTKYCAPVLHFNKGSIKLSRILTCHPTERIFEIGVDDFFDDNRNTPMHHRI